MSFLSEATKWVLFLPAAHQPEGRHLMDLAFGLMCLEKAGINPCDIAIYVDGNERVSIAQWLKNGSNLDYEIKYTADFFSDLQNNQYQNIILFITGHGNFLGLDGNPQIKPHTLVAGLKSAPNLMRAVVYFGQCDAGVFNYMPVSRKIREEEGHDPDIIFIGATDLHSSLSSSTREQFINGQLPWTANLFLLFVFKWMQDPVDIDGDGKVTIMDSYKFAGAQSNAFNKNVKAQAFVNCMQLHPSFVVAEQKHLSDPENLPLLVELEGIRAQYSDVLNIHFTHQECWILNSIPAQKWEIK
ncbi:hypothetical protein [Kerstersia gyiorum]|uniref:hypothetical protein n=1 Tax=Kerstersia gyiorum TaxID=206506 RepID=UPI0020A0BE0C|nr:hypothetical protein [Kerstersia gyiorum]MCP1679437.1 hypothetical protein [Kerstersia gyiorum]MCP1823940.1 hypothetical protein [Kerstersia gyiorum]MCP1827381.1 hypothetical protein [Kerstersia gyiorum]MCW2448970.1 hypothetical protein [Kerstersia gyiorum]